MPERSRQAIIQTDRGLETEKLARFPCRERRIFRKEFNAARREWGLLAGDGKGLSICPGRSHGQDAGSPGRGTIRWW